MNKFLVAAVVGLLAASVAVADIPPPAPPKGKKYVSVNSEVVLAKDVSGYVFVQQFSTGPGRPMFTYEKLELTPGKAKAMPAGGRRTYITLFAVPQDTAKEFKTDAELFDAIGANKVKGALRVGFAGTATVSDKIKGDSVKWTYTITAIDAKGIKTKVEGEGYEAPADKPGKKDGGNDAPDDSDEAAGQPYCPLCGNEGPNDPNYLDSLNPTTPRGGLLIAGLAAFAAIMLGGLWLVGRARRKV